MRITWEKYENPVYSSADGKMIDCQLTITNPPLGVVPFTAYANDVEQYSIDLYNEIIANANTVPIGAYVPPPPKANTASSNTATK